MTWQWGEGLGSSGLNEFRSEKSRATSSTLQRCRWEGSSTKRYTYASQSCIAGRGKTPVVRSWLGRPGKTPVVHSWSRSGNVPVTRLPCHHPSPRGEGSTSFFPVGRLRGTSYRSRGERRGDRREGPVRNADAHQSGVLPSAAYAAGALGV